MKNAALKKWLVMVLVVVAGIGIVSEEIVAQSILDRLKKAAEDASKGGQRPTTPAAAPAPKPAPPNTQQPAPAPPPPPPAAQPTAWGSSKKGKTQPLPPLKQGANITSFWTPHASHPPAVTSKGSRVVVTADG